MLKYNLSKIFSARGITNKTSFLLKIGFTSRVAYGITNERFVSLSPKHLERLCLGLNCTPNDLMEWQPDKPELLNEDIQLKKLLNAGNQYNIMNIVRGVPFDKMEEFTKKMEEVKKSL
ncbi:MAG: helix-turn-helix transcriptional regulator [Bacteroidetes bacterium]|nr:helix-turn-helix transcriptional regulator [Bacteroidota bacterium]